MSTKIMKRPNLILSVVVSQDLNKLRDEIKEKEILKEVEAKKRGAPNEHAIRPSLR